MNPKVETRLFWLDIKTLMDLSRARWTFIELVIKNHNVSNLMS